MKLPQSTGSGKGFLMGEGGDPARGRLQKGDSGMTGRWTFVEEVQAIFIGQAIGFPADWLGSIAAIHCSCNGLPAEMLQKPG